MDQNKNTIQILNPKTLVLSDDYITIIYEDNLFEDLGAAYYFNKDIQKYFNKKIVFNFNDINLELDEQTTLEELIESYEQQNDYLYEIQANKMAEKTINKIKEGNKEKRLLIEIFLLLELCNSKKQIISLSKRRKIRELFYNNQYPSLTQGIEIPKVKIKK